MRNPIRVAVALPLLACGAAALLLTPPGPGGTRWPEGLAFRRPSAEGPDAARRRAATALRAPRPGARVDPAAQAAEERARRRAAARVELPAQDLLLAGLDADLAHDAPADADPGRTPVARARDLLALVERAYEQDDLEALLQLEDAAAPLLAEGPVAWNLPTFAADAGDAALEREYAGASEALLRFESILASYRAQEERQAVIAEALAAQRYRVVAPPDPVRGLVLT